jgi:hypothetical protein
MVCPNCSIGIMLVALIPFLLVALGVVIAVFGKVISNFPYQPDETKTFTRPPVPRKHLICFLTLRELSPRRKRRI